MDCGFLLGFALCFHVSAILVMGWAGYPPGGTWRFFVGIPLGEETLYLKQIINEKKKKKKMNSTIYT